MKQRELLAEAIHASECGCEVGPEEQAYSLADALLARSVRVVTVGTLATALSRSPEHEEQWEGWRNIAEAALVALDNE